LKYFKFLPDGVVLWSKRKTFEFECEAYGYQLLFVNEKEISELKHIFAQWVVFKYNISDVISYSDALDRIKYYYNKFKKERCNE
jgi:hypothetical protein